MMASVGLAVLLHGESALISRAAELEAARRETRFGTLSMGFFIFSLVFFQRWNGPHQIFEDMGGCGGKRERESRVGD